MTIDHEDPGKGLLGLVMALLEVVRDLLARQALRRLENGTISDGQAERLGQALLELERAIADIKERHGIVEATADVRRQLDELGGRLLQPWSSDEGLEEGKP